MDRVIRIRTKNFSAKPLRGIIHTGKRVAVRLGSTTSTKEIFPKATVQGFDICEINTVQAINNSRSKLLMKSYFAESNLPQAEWWVTERNKYETIFYIEKKGNMVATATKKLPYPILAKRVFGFKGRGMTKIDNEDALLKWLKGHPSLDGWYFEKFYNYSREYRLHCTQEKVFMIWRKLRTKDAKERWFFNSSNCNWVGEDHKLFNKPSNWEEIKKASINALKSVGLDLGAIDVRVQSDQNKPPRFIICEVNSAPSLGQQGVEKYKQIIKELVT